MSSTVQVGPIEYATVPYESLGISFYNKLKKWDSDRIAVINSATAEEITYGHISKLSLKLATGLANLGIKKGDVITIVSQNNWKYFMTALAGWYLGARINLLNHAYTIDELKHFFSICPPNLIFGTTKTLPNLLQLRNELFPAVAVINYDGQNFGELLKATNDDSFKPVELNPEDVAFLVTSSGTSGLPKCVQLSHTNIQLLMYRCRDVMSLGANENSTAMCFAPFFNILGFAMGLTTLFFGTRAVIMEKFIPEPFLKLIEEHKVTTLFTVPSVLLYLAKSDLIEKYDISCIKVVASVAAPLAADLKEMVEKCLNISFVRHCYGMTEIGVGTMNVENPEKTGSVGKVVANTQIKVCDADTGISLPANRVGELRVKGEGVMKGYLGSNVTYEDVFDEQGFFKSGDLGYYDEDGFFYIVDRLKDIIKYKGFQVASVELEGVLSRHPAVRDVGVIGVPDEIAGEVPLAFVVKQPSEHVTEEELVRYVKENLCAPKRLYGGVKFVDAIPKGSGGKILKKRLKEMYGLI